MELGLSKRGAEWVLSQGSFRKAPVGSEVLTIKPALTQRRFLHQTPLQRITPPLPSTIVIMSSIPTAFTAEHPAEVSVITSVVSNGSSESDMIIVSSPERVTIDLTEVESEVDPAEVMSFSAWNADDFNASPWGQGPPVTLESLQSVLADHSSQASSIYLEVLTSTNKLDAATATINRIQPKMDRLRRDIYEQMAVCCLG